MANRPAGRRILLGWALAWLVVIAACSGPGAAESPTAAGASPTAAGASPTAAGADPTAAAPTATELPPTATWTPPAPTETPAPVLKLCSPLEGVSLEELPEILSNPYNEPDIAGTDDGHHGVDFGYYRYGDRITMLGLPVFSALPGKVAMTTELRYPYGYALLIETPLEDLPPDFVASLDLPPAEPLWPMDSRLYCPAPETKPTWDESRRSLYILYGHFQYKASVETGEAVDCGQQVGLVGTTGLSLNEHLHFEVRVGPAGARFESMDHYDNAATDSEMWNYCLWRTSGYFKLIDPMKVLGVGGESRE